MNKSPQNKLAVLIDKYSNAEGENETAIPGVFCFKATTTDTCLPWVYEPSLCLIAQGSKQLILDTEIYSYGTEEYLVASVDLPVIGQVMEASIDHPYLCLKIDIDLEQLSALLSHTGKRVDRQSPTTRGLFVGKLDDVIRDCSLRLARLLETPEDIPVIAPMIKREIYYRLLVSNYGDAIAQIAFKGSNMHRIAVAIQKIKSSYQAPLGVKNLAEMAGMSLSSFHAHFKSVTAMSPLQFQKRLRLIDARHIMLRGAMDAAGAAYHVGYESPSQFNREYARMFGNPPGRDISILKQRECDQEVSKI